MLQGRVALVMAGVAVAALGAAVFLFANQIIQRPYILTLTPGGAPLQLLTDTLHGNGGVATGTLLSPIPAVKTLHKTTDIEPQSPLTAPPDEIKALYATSWSAGTPKQLNQLIDLINATELNAIVIDIKDYSGFVAYDTGFEPAREYRAVEVRIPQINTVIKKLHDKNIYVIARLSVFQDQRLPLARPELALMSSSTGNAWKDRRSLMWIDAAAKDAWAYNIGIAKDALARGFDEINFDYIRFASDGDISDIVYPAWNKKQPRAGVMREFWKYLRAELAGARISADLFGLTTISGDDLGIGQRLEDALPYFDYVAPMVYPSHYYPGSLGYQQPAKYPYEIILHSLTTAFTRMKKAAGAYEKASAAATATTTPLAVPPKPMAKLRPWLQDFDLGATYTSAMVRKEIAAVLDSASTTPELLSGWMLWDPANIYTREALKLESSN